MSQTIAITGATGFAGRRVVAELLARGHRVKALVRDPAAAALPDDVQQVRGDLHDAAALDELARDADVLVHLAAAISALKHHDYFRVNAHGTVAVAAAARRRGLRRFVHVSSLAAREPALSPYGASKRAGEDAIGALADPLNAVILRPPAVYGPGDRGTLPLMKELTHPIAVIPGRSDARFSLIHVGDLARLIADAAVNDVKGIQEVSDGTAGGYGWFYLVAVAEKARGGRIRALFLPRALPLAVALAAEALSRFTGKPGLVNRGKVAELYHRDWVSGPSSLRLANPITFAKGFPETIDWYIRAGWLPRSAMAGKTAT